MNRTRWIRFAAGAAMCVFSASSFAAQNYTILGGPIGGAWYRIVSGLASIVHQSDPSIDLKALPGGGVANPARVGNGSADFAISLTVPTVLAIRGKEMYPQKFPDIRAVAFGFSPLYLQVVVPKDFPYNTLAEALAHHYKLEIAAPSASTFGNWITKWLLHHYGTSPHAIRAAGGAFYQVSHAQQAEMLQDKRVNMMITLESVPTPSVIQVGSQRDIRILDLAPTTRAEMIKVFGFQKGDVDKTTYKDVSHLEMPAQVHTVAMSSGIIVNSRVPEKVVYAVTKALYGNAAEVQQVHPSLADFQPDQVARSQYRANGTIKLAVGARKYIEQKGYPLH